MSRTETPPLMPFCRGRRPFFSTLQPRFIYILDDEWICKCIQNAIFVRILQKHTHTHTHKLNLVLHGTNMPLMISADVEIQKLFIQKISACFHTVVANTHPVTPKTTSRSKADLTKWDPSDNICIQTSRLQNLNPYEHLILISPPSKTN